MLGAELRKARLRAGLTQQDVAGKASIDRAYISEIERGRAMPSVERFLRICEAIGIRGSRIIAKIEQKRPRNQ